VGDCPFVSVVMPVHNEIKFISRSVPAVLNQDYARDRMEIIIADGMSTDGTRKLLQEYALADNRLLIIDNPKSIVAAGLNAAFAVSRGQIIVRVDGHCEIARDYVRRCVAHLLEDGVDGVGGSVETIGETYIARVIAKAMSSKFGVGNSSFRTVHHRTLLADTIPFPAYRREIIEKAGPYDEELVRNQDDEYNYRLRERGAKLLLAADVKSRYYSRSSLKMLWRQYYQYGFWKVRVMRKHPRQMSTRQYVPAVFVAALLSIGATSIVFPSAAPAFLFIAASYALASLSAAIWTCRNDLSALPAMPLAFAALHLGYGLGFLWGLIRLAVRAHKHG
jgi:succinoglycan biosynthesis protein ExoA